MIEMIGGEGTIEKRIPAMMRMFANYGIDIRKTPILVYPTLHYQNGGIDIDGNCMSTTVNNLFVAGEAVGGIHGRNRLMGNSLLDIIVFGRDAGKAAAEQAKKVTVGKLTLSHVDEFEKELDDRFFRAGRSLIINLKYIRRVTKTEVSLSDGTLLPLPRGAYEPLNRAIIKHT